MFPRAGKLLLMWTGPCSMSATSNSTPTTVGWPALMRPGGSLLTARAAHII